VTRPNLSLVPADYQRKQTLVNSERFITPELKEYEERVLGAEARIKELEYELSCRLERKSADRFRGCSRWPRIWQSSTFCCPWPNWRTREIISGLRWMTGDLL